MQRILHQTNNQFAMCQTTDFHFLFCASGIRILPLHVSPKAKLFTCYDWIIKICGCLLAKPETAATPSLLPKILAVHQIYGCFWQSQKIMTDTEILDGTWKLQQLSILSPKQSLEPRCHAACYGTTLINSFLTLHYTAMPDHVNDSYWSITTSSVHASHWLPFYNRMTNDTRRWINKQTQTDDMILWAVLYLVTLSTIPRGFEA